MSPDPARAEIVVDVAAIRHNVRRLREVVARSDTSAHQNTHLGTQESTPRHARTHTSALMMTVVKADGYGHGMLPAARAARAGGADWLGVATLDEALTLRAGGDTGPILCWLAVPGEDYAAAVELDIDVTAYSLAELDEIESAARSVGGIARVQVKIDTGLSRGGCALADWPTLAGAARKAEENGHVRVTGVWSHFACSDDPEHPANDDQEAVFREALAVADDAGLTPEVRHLANSAAAILPPEQPLRPGPLRHRQLRARPRSRPGRHRRGRPGARDDRPRPPRDGEADAGRRERVLRPHLDRRSGRPRSRWCPLGYGDGVPRAAGNRAEVGIGGKRRPIRGVVCMDQFVVDLGDDDAVVGDEVVLFGTGVDGPTATDWAEAVGTINYEIVTRIGGRFTRRTVDSEESPA